MIRSALTAAASIGILATLVADATGQQRGVSQTLMATVTSVAPIYIEARILPTPLRTAAVGTRLEVLEEGTDWSRVRFADPQFGPRIGFVETRHLRIERPELQPMDLSVPAPASTGRPASPEGLGPTPRVPGRVTQESIQQNYQPPDDDEGFERGWIDVDIGVAFAAETDYGIRFERPLFQERAAFEARYQLPTGADFDFGGGAMITKAFGLGLSISGTAHQHTAHVLATIPHPTRFNVPDSDEADTSDVLTRAEGAVHIQAMFSGTPSPRARVRLFGGPSYFRVTQDTIDDIRYLQTFQLLGSNQITITTVPFSESESTAWGFHVGGDVSVFFTRVVGVGGLVRFSRATITLVDLGGTTIETKAGGVQVAGGLRLKF